MGETPGLAVVMDWGGTWARAAVAGRAGNLLWSTRQPNSPGATKDQLLSGAETVLQQAIDWCGETPIAGIGIAAAGPIDIETGTFHEPPNLGALDGVSLKQLWEPKWGHQVFIGNDATLAALGEYHYGAGVHARREGRPARTLVYVTVSTGIGGGVIDRGHMLTGAEGMAAEVGHMTVDPSGGAPQCQCGNYGCLEALASGTAVAKMAGARLSQPGVNSTLSSLEPGQVTGERVFNAASQGDPLALDVPRHRLPRPHHRPGQPPPPLQPRHHRPGRRSHQRPGQRQPPGTPTGRHRRPGHEPPPPGLPTRPQHPGRVRSHVRRRQPGLPKHPTTTLKPPPAIMLRTIAKSLRTPIVIPAPYRHSRPLSSFPRRRESRSYLAWQAPLFLRITSLCNRLAIIPQRPPPPSS